MRLYFPPALIFLVGENVAVAFACIYVLIFLNNELLPPQQLRVYPVLFDTAVFIFNN